MNKKMSKAAKVRRMLGKGDTVEQIVGKLKTSKQYVYGIKSKMNKVKLDAEMIQPGPFGMAQKKKKEGVKKSYDLNAELDIPTPTANDTQVGGAHYKALDPQPWDVVHSWGMGFLSGNVIKYLARYESKNGIEDLQKARHYLDKLIETVK